MLEYIRICHMTEDNYDTVDRQDNDDRSGGTHEWEEGDRLLAVMREEREGILLRTYETTATKIAAANQIKQNVEDVIPVKQQ